MTTTDLTQHPDSPREGVRSRTWKSHAAYKNSGLEWLGPVPTHWDVTRLDRVVCSPVVRASALERPFVALEHIQPYIGSLVDGFEPETRATEDYLLFEPGDVLFGKLRPYLRKYWRGTFPGCCPGELLVLRPANTLCTSDFLYYLVQSSYFVSIADATSYGVKMPRTSWEALRRQRIPIPPRAEQRAIATFVDRETARIDALIAKKERLIELLHERRAALINQAVTKGLDPSVPMKDSGIEWIGRIPAHWEVRRLKHLAKLESGHTPSRSVPEYWENCTIPWVSLADVWQLRRGNMDYIEETKEKISELGLANSAARLLPKDTVILSRTASVGFAAILAQPMATTQDFVNWICGPHLEPRFLLHCFRAMTQEFDRLTMGSTHKTIYMSDVAQFTIPLPPLSEQIQIDTFVTEQTRRVDRLVTAIRQQIERLQEYRTALISAAVTGQIDVREEVAV